MLLALTHCRQPYQPAVGAGLTTDYPLSNQTDPQQTQDRHRIIRPADLPIIHHTYRPVSIADTSSAAPCATARTSVFPTLPRPPYATTPGVWHWDWDRAPRRATRLASDAFWNRKGA